MKAVIVKDDIVIKTSDRDECETCKNLSICPLIKAIETVTVVLRYEEIEIVRCGMYL